MEHLDVFYDVCDSLSRELGEANDKIKEAGGKMSAGDIEYIDKLTHAIKSVKTTIAMIEADGESGTYMPSYVSRGSYRGRESYARGRDSMGRYSSRRGGMSTDDGMIDELHRLMEQAPNEETRRDFRRLIDKMEKM